jgi:K+-sensing histidine kinase KdpD
MTPVLVKSAARLVRHPVSKLGADCGYQQLVSDIFHDLSQPLSTLTCLLEINLLLSRTVKQWRHDVKIALKQIRSVVWLVRALRELWEAGSAHQNQEVLSVAVCLREVVAELLPAAKLAKAKIFLTSSSDCLVNMQASRLQQGFTGLLNFAMESGAGGTEVKIVANEEDKAAQVTVAISTADLPGTKAVSGRNAAELAEGKRRDLERRLGLAVAWRVFESADGSLRAEDRGDRLWLEVRLPLVSLPK